MIRLSKAPHLPSDTRTSDNRVWSVLENLYFVKGLSDRFGVLKNVLYHD